MMKYNTSKTAFTMVELTVVLAVIAMLLSALSAAGEKSRYHARRAICENNLRQQITFQLQYAADNSGKFAPFAAHEPSLIYDKQIDGYLPDPCMPSPLQVHQLYGPYFAQASGKILICPLTSIFAKEAPDRYGYYADTSWMTAAYNLGGWNSTTPQGTLPDYIEITYSWFMGFSAYRLRTEDWKWLDGETPWPKTLAQCTSTAAAGSHVFNSSYVHNSNKFRNFIHGGSAMFWGRRPDRDLTRKGESPAAYSDGHVEQHQFESQGNQKIKTRTIIPPYGCGGEVWVAY